MAIILPPPPPASSHTSFFDALTSPCFLYSARVKTSHDPQTDSLHVSDVLDHAQCMVDCANSCADGVLPQQAVRSLPAFYLAVHSVEVLHNQEPFC